MSNFCALKKNRTRCLRCSFHSTAQKCVLVCIRNPVVALSTTIWNGIYQSTCTSSMDSPRITVRAELAWDQSTSASA